MAGERIGLIAASFGKISTLVEHNHRKRESPLGVPETQSASHPPAPRTAFRDRDVCQQSRSSVLSVNRWIQTALSNFRNAVSNS
jgi:hypothetical protein